MRKFSLAVLLFFLVPIARAEDYTAPGVTLAVGDPNGVRPKPLSDLEIGDSLAVELSGAAPKSTVEMKLEDAKGREWSYSRVHADERGDVPRTLFWYQSGVAGTTARRGAFRPDPSFLTFDEAARFFETNALQLTVRERDGRLLATREVRPQPRRTPFVYPSNGAGVLENAVNGREESLYATGRNFPAGATVQLYLVPNRFGYGVGDPFEPIGDAIKTVTLDRGQTGFTVELAPRMRLMKGSYDIIARTDVGREWQVQDSDVISFGEDTGVVIYAIWQEGNWVIDAAGRLAGWPSLFQYSNSFQKGEDVYAAVDPTDVFEGHTGGSYAAYYVVKDEDSEYWNADNSPLIDITNDGKPVIHRVKAYCINDTRVKVWNNATQTAAVAGYDVIVDFGQTAAYSSADFQTDGKYNKGLDFVDGFYDAGFYVLENPGASGTFKVGTADLEQEGGISGISDPNGQNGPKYPVTLAWARIKYPATQTGTEKPVAAGGPFPIVLFLHGNHAKCDFDGGGPGQLDTNAAPCPSFMRVPSHLGYDYIMEKLASQGFFCISVNAYDIQAQNDEFNFIARGKLVLKFLDKLRDWNDGVDDPFDLFQGKLDLSRIGLSGHSRGGEGVAAAQKLNATWPGGPHSILAINAIAPTDMHDGSATPFVPTVAYFLLAGARDGDVNTMHGFRTYDRMFPQGAPDRKAKAIAYVHGANHNQFNTIWTPSIDLGEGGGWAGAKDDCDGTIDPLNTFDCSDKLASPLQREIAIQTIGAFFRWQLKGVAGGDDGEAGYREVLTGVLKPDGIANDRIFWTFQDGDRLAVDNFAQENHHEDENSLGGAVTETGFTKIEETHLNHDGQFDTDVPSVKDKSFCHDTSGLRLDWNGVETYTSNIPAGQKDVSMYTYVTFRVAKKSTVYPPQPGPDVVLRVNLEDTAGNTADFAADTSMYARIPHPYIGSELPNLSQMSSIRIPLQFFTANGSGVDLTNVAKITIRTPAESFQIGIDDIEFGK